MEKIKIIIKKKESLMIFNFSPVFFITFMEDQIFRGPYSAIPEVFSLCHEFWVIYFFFLILAAEFNIWYYWHFQSLALLTLHYLCYRHFYFGIFFFSVNSPPVLSLRTNACKLLSMRDLIVTQIFPVLCDFRILDKDFYSFFFCYFSGHSHGIWRFPG